MRKEKVEIDKELLRNILIFFMTELEDYTGACREDYNDDTTLAQIYDQLRQDFPQKKIDEIFKEETR